MTTTTERILHEIGLGPRWRLRQGAAAQAESPVEVAGTACLFIGEALSGEAGELLDNMLAAIQLRRGENVNVMDISVPGNDLAAIERFRPKLIVALGQKLMRPMPGIDPAARGAVQRYGEIPLLLSFSPVELLRHPANKAAAWTDLCRVREMLAMDAH